EQLNHVLMLGLAQHLGFANETLHVAVLIQDLHRHLLVRLLGPGAAVDRAAAALTELGEDFKFLADDIALLEDCAESRARHSRSSLGLPPPRPERRSRAVKRRSVRSQAAHTA